MAQAQSDSKVKQSNTTTKTTTTKASTMGRPDRSPSVGSETTTTHHHSDSGASEIFSIPFMESDSNMDWQHHSQQQQQQQQQQKLQPTFLSPSRTTSTTSANDGSVASSSSAPIPPPVLVYHESARSIVFRDHLRRAVKKEQEGDRLGASAKRTVTTEYVTELMDADRDAMAYVPPDDMIHDKTKGNNDASIKKTSEASGDTDFAEVKDEQDSNEDDCVLAPLPHMSSSSRSISNCFQPSITPLPKLALGPNDELQALLGSPNGEDGNVDPNWTVAEREVVERLGQQQALVKTIKNVEWTPLLHRFQIPNERRQNSKFPTEHDDISPNGEDYSFNSFVTSCTLLPPFGKKMRAYGSPTMYTAGVVFLLPKHHVLTTGVDDNNGSTNSNLMVISEEEAATMTKTWSWPAGYSAKTEFNIDGRGNLVNGRDEALVSLSQLRSYNVDYLTKEDHSKLRFDTATMLTVPSAA